jgi:CheY-like chemotaxis protein
MAPLLRRTISETIEIATVSGQSGSSALVDRTLLESALLNLAVNAKDAMPGGGTLTITAGERLAGAGDGTLPEGRPLVYVTVSDTGTGMAPDVLERAFEPFFTTKEVGKGSGLGLSMVYGFAQQSGGHVAIESEPGRGTSVTILLPAVGARDRADGDAAGRAAAPQAAPSGQGRVLVVEDEPQVRHVLCTQLVTLGYAVEAASTAADALDVLTRDANFDVLLADAVLPKGMSGVELARRARAIKPDFRILLTSGAPGKPGEPEVGTPTASGSPGDPGEPGVGILPAPGQTPDPGGRTGLPDAGAILLAKPYRRQDLAAALRRVLGSEGRPGPDESLRRPAGEGA